MHLAFPGGHGMDRPIQLFHHPLRGISLDQWLGRISRSRTRARHCQTQPYDYAGAIDGK